jgi:hypothetical protein
MTMKTSQKMPTKVSICRNWSQTWHAGSLQSCKRQPPPETNIGLLNLFYRRIFPVQGSVSTKNQSTRFTIATVTLPPCLGGLSDFILMTTLQTIYISHRHRHHKMPDTAAPVKYERLAKTHIMVCKARATAQVPQESRSGPGGPT